MKGSAMLSKGEYDKFETQFAEERKFFESWTEQYPLLNDIIAGNISFADKEVELFAGYQRDAMAGLDFGSFVDMVGDLSGLELNFFDRILIDTSLLILDKKPDGYKSKDMFKPIAEACAGLDQKIRRCYGLAFFRQTPEAFEEECSAMEPAEREYARMKMFEQLDAEYVKFGDTLNSLCEQHEFVEKIANGRATFTDTARSLEQRFGEVQLSFREIWSNPIGKMPERCGLYVEELVSLTEVLDVLTEEDMQYGLFHLGVELGFKGMTLKGIDLKGLIKKEFSNHIALAEKTDRKLCLHLAPRFVTEAPDRFREAYDAAHSLEQEYVKDRLLKAVGAGAVRNMSEIELLKFFDSLDKQS